MITATKTNPSDTTVVDMRGPSRGKSSLPVPASEQKKAASANKRINVPLNLDNWQHIDDSETVDQLTWFHQHVLNEGYSWDQIEELLPKGKSGFYNRNTIYKVLVGTHEGSWHNIANAIISYRELWDDRRKIKKSYFSPNEVSSMIWAGLDYALSANGITQINGESGQGKTMAARQWQDRNNHGKTVFVECPVNGGMKGLMREIAGVIGANRNQSVIQMQDSIRRAFNANRILIIDEAGRLLPSDRSTPPKNLDFLRWIHDQTRCGLALITTHRFGHTLKSNSWMFEQLLGRIDMPITLPHQLSESTWLPLLKQFIQQPSTKLKNLCDQIANTELGGRMRRLDKLLKLASRISANDKQALGEAHVMKAVKMLEQMTGEKYIAKRYA